jgi:hypothetical protein
MSDSFSLDLASGAGQWAQAEFGGAELGDRRRVKRTVLLAARAAVRPNAYLTAVCLSDAERQGAYGLLSNDAVSVAALAASAHQAGARRLADDSFAFIPTDATTVRVSDPGGRTGAGPVAGQANRHVGFLVMTALGVDPAGTIRGVVEQRWWSRPPHKNPGRKAPRPRKGSKAARRKAKRKLQKHKRPIGQKETSHWLEVLTATAKTFHEQAPATRPWFQCDRGADFAELWQLVDDQDLWATVRVQRNRRVVAPSARTIAEQMALAPRQGTFLLQVPARKGQPARLATMEVRAEPVTLQLPARVGSGTVLLYGVSAREISALPPGAKRLDWLLVTSVPVTTAEEALLVVLGYAQRWRVEEFHKVWKTSGCDVEDTLLQTTERIQRWATLLASVAARTLQLTRQARQTPEAPAPTWFSPDEIDATLLLRRPPGWKPGEVPTLGQMVRWVADLGGYTGPTASGGPPGAIVLGRGLRQIEAVARALRSQRDLNKALPPRCD